MCVCDEPNQKRAEQLLVAQLSECFLNLHVQIYVRLNTYFLIWKWVFKPKNFFINKGERTDQEEKKKRLFFQHKTLCQSFVGNSYGHSSTRGYSFRYDTTKIRKSLVLFDMKHILGGGSQTKTERMAHGTACSLTWV